MQRAPDWTESEFEIVVKSYEELLAKLQGRTVDAVEIVKQGIHNFHRGANTSMLSKMMLRYLEDKRETMICPKCGIRF